MMGGIPHVIRQRRFGGEPRIEANPLLDAGERAWSYTTKQVKFGDGERRWDELPVAKIEYAALDDKLAMPKMRQVAEEEVLRDRFDPLPLINLFLNPGL